MEKTKDKISQLKSDYGKKKDEIKQRLLDFEKVGKMPGKIFYELCFCLCTPQSSAVVCDRAIRKLEASNAVEKRNFEKIKSCLETVRFKNNKAKYILEAAEKFYGKDVLAKAIANKSNTDTREWLVSNIKGIGYKEASHFLRNIGLGQNIAILDRHILKNMKSLDIIREVPKTITKKRYLEMESRLRQFSEKVSIPVEELDLLFWSNETGHIFK